MTITESILISTARKKTFAYLIDPESRKQIIPLLEEVIFLDDGPIDVGSKYIEISSIAGRRFETTYMVIIFKKNKQISVVARKSIFPIRVDMKLSDDGSNTLISIDITLQLKGIYALGAPLIKSIVAQQTRDILVQMKRNLEKPAKKTEHSA
jgi:carbon monoxide dehydrogenase subunit G